MLIEDVTRSFKSLYRLHKEWGISLNTVSNWKIRGYIPIETQVRIEKLSGGRLKADLNHIGNDDDRRREEGT